ncbi:hypothetical protein AAEO56_11525 [Flavobacterium sp. DGU11]|uniref:Uncharacterized protein n=1 Tax=Flavobacterium arundinis TaxID=3139143 RepID=A0ABU9HXJ9_9FLAO
MKKTILLFGLGVFFTACSDDNASTVDDNPINTENKVLLLKVDLLTNTFEGGKELIFPDADGFTIGHDYVSPGDFGSIKLKYTETGGTIFDGTIIWSGLGGMTYPEALDAPNTFSVMDNSGEMPALSQFETVNYLDEGEGVIPPAEIDYQSIWNAISDLQQVAAYRASNPNAKIHLFLYTPSVGIGDPHDWDWFVILKN